MRIRNWSLWGEQNIEVRWDYGPSAHYSASQLKKYRFKESEQLGMEV